MKALIVTLLSVLILCVFLPLYVIAQPSPAGGNFNELDGIDDYAQGPDSDSLDVGDEESEDLTIEAWVYPNKFPSVPVVFINEAVIAGKKKAYRIHIVTKDDGKFGFSAFIQNPGGSSGGGPLVFPDGVVPNRWYHIAYVITWAR